MGIEGADANVHVTGTATIIKVDESKRVVLGVIYEPDVRDTDGNFMAADEIEKMAYLFMEEMRGDQIDLQHDFMPQYGVVVESFIAREGDQTFPVGAWVLGVRVTDDDVWDAIQKGEVTGYSMAGTAELVEDGGDKT